MLMMYMMQYAQRMVILHHCNAIWTVVTVGVQTTWEVLLPEQLFIKDLIVVSTVNKLDLLKVYRTRPLEILKMA